MSARVCEPRADDRCCWCRSVKGPDESTIHETQWESTTLDGGPITYYRTYRLQKIDMDAPWQQVYDMDAASYILHDTKPHGGLPSSRSCHSNRKCICPLGRSVDVTLLPVYACEGILDVTFLLGYPLDMMRKHLFSIFE